jgi:hypothetical protein
MEISNGISTHPISHSLNSITKSTKNIDSILKEQQQQQ